ncbi:flippase, partial [Vibrio sp. 10N.222.51.C8]|uniref:flippase n=1 Tax=Vibrio sp. 10N.222.51.C8 TaxID=3229624 RepID=UPI003553600C
MKKISEINVLKNASWIIVSKAFQALLQLLILIIVARNLGPEEFGVLSYAMSLVVFVTPLAFLGINNTLVHEIISNPQKQGVVIGTSITLSLVSSVFSGLLIQLFIYIANPGEEKLTIVCLLYSLVLLFQALELIKYWFQAKLLSKYSSIISLLAYVAIAIYNIIIFLFDKSIYWFTVSNVLVFMLMSVILLIYYYKLGGESLSFSSRVATLIWSKAKHFILPSVMVAIYSQSDRVMLQQMVGDRGVGLYSAALSVASMASFLFVAVIDSFRPLIFNYYHKSNLKFEYYLKKTYSIVLYLSIFQAIFISIFSGVIIKIIFGSEYLGAVSTLMIICWYIMFSFLGAVRNIWILSNGLERYLFIINLGGAIINIVMNYFLIPRYGIEGAAVASLVTQIITNFVFSYLISPMRKSNKLLLNGIHPKYLKT